MTAAWWYDGSRMHEPLLLEHDSFEVHRKGPEVELDPMSPHDLRFAGRPGSYRLDISLPEKRTAFHLDQERITVGDVLAGCLLGGWLQPLQHRVTGDLAAEAYMRGRGVEVPEDALQTALNEWRTARDLIAAEEFEEWIESTGLEIDELAAHLERRVLRSRLSPAVDLSRHAPDWDLVLGLTSGAWHGGLLFVYIVLIGILAEILSVFLNAGIEASGLPLALAAVMVALVSASPEILTAIRAAHEHRMQTVVNIALGASLATVLMTIPLVEAVALFSGIDIVMGLTPLQGGMILLTMMTAMINFNDGETNALEGLVHLVLFLAFASLLFLA